VDSARKEQRCVDVYAKEFLCRRQVAVLVEIIEAQRASASGRTASGERPARAAGVVSWLAEPCHPREGKITARPCFHLRMR
jgi:hypothetical protein